MQKQGNSKFKLHNERSFVMTKRILAGLVVAAFLLSCSLALASPFSCNVVNNKAEIYADLSAQTVGCFVPITFGSEVIKVTFADALANWTNYTKIDGKMAVIGGLADVGPNIDANALPLGKVLLATIQCEGSPEPINLTSLQLPGQQSLTAHLVAKGGVVYYREEDKTITTTTSPSVPTQFRLEQNYPNPFNPQTAITFSVPTTNTNAKVNVRIYNIMGQIVRTLANGVQMSGGEHTVTWDGKDNAGNPVASGVYFCNVNVDKIGQKFIRMTLLK